MPLLPPPNDLCEYLGKAVAYPRLLNTGSSREGATLALAVHCLFIQQGFSIAHTKEEGVRQVSAYNPPSGWNVDENVWQIDYYKDGYANNFTLQCSLDRQSGRFLVAAREITPDDDLSNTEYLGLLLPKYVPSFPSTVLSDWDNLVTNQSLLTDMISLHVLDPILTRAEEAIPETLSVSAASISQSIGSPRKDYAVAGKLVKSRLACSDATWDTVKLYCSVSVVGVAVGGALLLGARTIVNRS